MHLLVGCRTGLRSVWKRTNLIVYQDMTMSIAWVSQHWAGVWPQMFTTGNGVLSGYCTESYHDIKFKICEMFHKSHFSLLKCSKISSTPYSIHLPYILSNHHFIQPHDPKVVMLRGPNWPFCCFRFFDIIFENLVTLIWELAALVKLFLYFHKISTFFQYFIQLSDTISENLLGNPDLGASCPDQTISIFS